MMEYLTGRRRFRRIKTIYDDGDITTDYLILQVEVSRFRPGRKGHPGKWVCSFRNAHESDITPAEKIV